MTAAAIRVLLVDDDPEVAWAVGRCLTRAGFTVTTCGDGAEAMNVLQGREFDVLVTDIQMPRVNGLTLVDWVRHHRPRVRVVVITAYGSAAVQRVAVSKGAILYLDKPVDPQVLIDVLKTHQNEGSFSGSVEGIDLFDCIQMVLLTRGRHVLEIQDPEGKVCHLWVDRGNVLHADCAGVEGVEAFRRCIGFQGGRFTTLPWKEPGRVSIEIPGNVLLMDAARAKDEGDHHEAEPETLDDLLDPESHDPLQV